MSGIPSMNFICLVLCRIRRIVINMATEPPSNDKSISVFSGVRSSTRFFFDIFLSYMHTITEIIDITKIQA